jgi:two-component system chemotaxis response regulator CheB/chemosensory pili system protein ChpB (putative protein-glutamate methylesterase)
VSELAHPVLPVALVFGDAEASVHLRAALDEIGARVVCDTPVESLDAAVLDGSGAGVVLVNLDDNVEERLDAVYDSLDESRYRVVFNDPGISHGLSGWEHARWLRHLAAKLRDDGDFDPPRPREESHEELHEEPAAAPAAEGWLDEALDVLKEQPAPSQGVPDVARVVDVDLDTVELGDIEIADVPQDVAADATDEPAPPAVVDMVGPTPGDDIATDFDDNIFDEAQALLAARQDGEADADHGMPAVETVAVEMDPGLADTDWNSLEAELEAAFSNDALAAVDAAASHPVEEASAEQPVESHEAVEPTQAAAPQAVPAEDIDIEPAVLAAPSSDQWDLTDDEIAPTAPAAPHTVEETPAEPQPSEVDKFDLDRWSLVEMEADRPLDRPSMEPVEHWLDPSKKPQKIAEEVAEKPQPVAEEAGGTDEDFGIELVDAIDYLAPAAPPDDGTQDYVAPDLMPMAEAVAPEVEGEVRATAAAHTASQPLRRVVVLGASIGGPDAVRELLSGLPARFPATFILVQHLGSEFVDLMISQLGKSSALPVRIPGNGERAVAGEVLVVPHGRQLHLPRSGEVTLTSLPEGSSNDPSINLTMAMAAEAFGEDALAIIFSGMASDAVSGALEIAAHGGTVWAQDPASCVVSTMVDGVISAGVARFVGTPGALAEHLIAEFASEAGT